MAQLKSMKTCVVIPTYNESRTIGGLVNDIKRKGLDVLVIDDGSVDDTGRIAKDRGAFLITHARNRGKGASIRRGFEHALKNDYGAVIMMDGDGQHNPEDLPRFIKAVEDTDAELIIGNRMGDIRSMPLLRRLTNGLTSHIISKFSGQHIPDSQCGFRLIKRNVLEKIRLISLNFEIESEILIRAAKQKFKILSIPIKTIYQGEASRINPFLDTFRFIRMVFNIKSQKKNKRT